MKTSRYRFPRFWFGRSLVRVGVAACLFCLAACSTVEVNRYYQRGALATVSPLATQAGNQILMQGGNAFDAAVTVGFVLAVTYPLAGNLGGGGFAVVRQGSSGDVRALDFREMAPAGASADMFLDSTGEVVSGLSTRTVLAAGVPGTVAGLHALWKEYGTLPWNDLVTVAAAMADTGFALSSHVADEFIQYEDLLVNFEETKAIFMPEGRPFAAGEKLRQVDLARTLYRIAAEGPEDFYKGETAAKLVACMEKYDGLITAADLAQYRPVWREPTHFTFDSLDIYSMPPPSSGGICVGQLLKLLEPYELSGETPLSPSYIHLFCEAARLSYADRSQHLGDPDFYDIPESLLEEAYLDQRRSNISADHAGSSAEVSPGAMGRPESDQTTHFSICDSAGNMVSITTTINGYFGSGLVVEGAGFLLNNEMDDFSIKPGHPNRYGLVGGEANKIEAGKRMLSSMAPTLILNDDRPFMVLGSPGGSKIITTIAQAIVGVSRFGLSVNEVVSQPRFHHQWLPDQIFLEEGKFDVATKQRLIRYGHHIKERSPYGDLEIVFINSAGLMTAASDWRRGGAPAGCNDLTP